MKTIRYIDVCCGIGGFRVGLEQFQILKDAPTFECVFSIDLKPDALTVYNANFKEQWTPTDLYTIDIATLPSFDLLCCGFPCQPFSAAGNKQGFSDARGGMIFTLLEMCAKHRPTMLLLENVSNLMTLEKGRYMNEIQRLFSELGYLLSVKKYNSKDFGIPQSRERVFIVGSLTRKIMLPDPCTPIRSLKTAIDNTAQYTDIDPAFAQRLLSLHQSRPLYGYKIQDKRGGAKNLHSWDLDYCGAITADEKELMNQLLLQRRKKHWAVAKNIPWMDGMPLTETEIRTFYPHANLSNMLERLQSLGYLKYERPKTLVNGKRHYQADGEYGYNICKGKLSFPISRILDPEDVSPTLTATDACKLVVLLEGRYIRKLTTMELKRLCGYPDTFQVPDNVDAYDLFGNTVMPPIVYELLKAMYL